MAQLPAAARCICTRSLCRRLPKGRPAGDVTVRAGFVGRTYVSSGVPGSRPIRLHGMPYITLP
ncbi:hypothetical protein RHECNPAF_4310086 [Rhizobium etli CNPAF512]|nr:hypothetical protein RHECNPAF_4310086 [Rhizobium etli CNPAF512]